MGTFEIFNPEPAAPVPAAASASPNLVAGPAISGGTADAGTASPNLVAGPAISGGTAEIVTSLTFA